MSVNVDTIATSLFEKIRSRFDDVSVGDQDAKSTTDPAKSRFFNFDYINEQGDNFGNVTISLIDERSLKVYFGKNVSSNLDEVQKTEWYDFLRDMRMFAKRNLLSFDTRDISRSNLDLKDIQQLSAVEKPAATNELSVTEGKLYGSTKTSYEAIAPGTRLVIRHSAAVDEAVQGSRSRKIRAVYIEDVEGQRFKSPTAHLGGARALARHISHGGQINDEFSGHILEVVQEIGKLKKFIQGSRNKVYEDGEANELVAVAKERYHNIHHILHKLKGIRGYKFYKESWKPSSTLQDDIDLENLKSKFVQKNFDERLEDALPHIYRAYQDKKANAVDERVNEFAEWTDQVTEGTWSVPDNDMAMQELQELMSDVLEAGIDGQDASGALYDILGDDDLFDRIYDAAQGSPEIDVRPIVYDWLRTNMPTVFEKVKADMESGPKGHDALKKQEPQQEAEPTEESADRVSDLRRLAGLR